MKKSLFLLGIVFSFVVFASKPRSGINDLADSRGTGVQNVQFWFGGSGESLEGALDEKAILQTFRSNVIGQYRCFSTTYGGQSKAVGTLYVRINLPPAAGRVAGSDIRVDSTELNSPEFLDCLKTYWSKVKLPPATDGGAGSLVMPIHARLRPLSTGT